MSSVLMILVFTFAYSVKGGVLKLYQEGLPSGKLLSLALVALSMGVYHSDYLGNMVYDFNFKMAFLGGIAWAMGAFPALGNHVRLQAGMRPIGKSNTWIDRAVKGIKNDKLKGWAGLSLRGALTGAPFALLLNSPLIIPICATMPVWYWLSIYAHKVIKKKPDNFPWIAEILYGAVIGLSYVLAIGV